jgi:hypothetical protein
MNAMRTIFAAVLILLLAPITALPDQPRPNAPIVAAGDDGTCYAKSIPSDVIGQQGRTTIYRVGPTEDEAVASYDWYSLQIHLDCNPRGAGYTSTTVVRMGPWALGRRANADDLALAFYAKGTLLKQYSTLDIAGNPRNVSASVSHYWVFSSVEGFQWNGNKQEFVATRSDGSRVRFSSETGERIESK